MGDTVTRMEYLRICGRSSRQLETYIQLYPQDCHDQRSFQKIYGRCRNLNGIFESL